MFFVQKNIGKAEPRFYLDRAQQPQPINPAHEEPVNSPCAPPFFVLSFTARRVPQVTRAMTSCLLLPPAGDGARDRGKFISAIAGD